MKFKKNHEEKYYIEYLNFELRNLRESNFYGYLTKDGKVLTDTPVKGKLFFNRKLKEIKCKQDASHFHKIHFVFNFDKVPKEFDGIKIMKYTKDKHIPKGVYREISFKPEKI